MPMIDSMEYVVTLLWRVSWQASLLVLLVLLAQGLMRHRLSPSWRSALWLLVVARLLLPVTPSSGLSLFNLTGGRVVPATSASNGIGWGDAGEGTGLAAAEAARLEVGPWWSAAMEDRVEHFGDAWAAQRGPVPSSDWAVESVEAVRSVGSVGSVGSATRPFHWMAILFWVWLAGILVLGVRVGGSAVMLTRRVRQEPPVTNPEVLAMFVECRRDMGTCVPVTLVETSEVDSPALFGFWRLNLLLPPQTLRRLSGAELRHVFLHELAHVRRGDVILNWLATLIQILHWFNPVIWFALARMRADREVACDALALERGGLIDRMAYGATILKLVSGLGSSRPAPGLVGISEGKSNLKRRIQMIAMNRQPRRWPWLAGMILIVLGLVSLTDARTARVVEELEEIRGLEWVAGGASSDAEEPVVPGFDADGVSEEVADAPPIPRDFVSAATSSTSTTLIEAAPGRQGIESMLHRIVLEEVMLDGLVLPAVVDYLDRATQSRSPEGKGINFLIDRTHHSPLTAAPRIDPATGQVIIEAAPFEPVDLDNVRIRIVPSLPKVQLGYILDAIVRVADQPIRYSIEEYGIVFSQRLPGQDAAPFETRIFHVDPAWMSGDLRAIQGEEIQEDEPKVNSQEAMRQFIGSLGIDIRPPNQVYFNDRKGVLMVRATPHELDEVQQAIRGRVTTHRGPRSYQQDPAPAPRRDAADTATPGNPGQQAIRSKLHQIILDEVRFDNVALPEVLRYLHDVTLARDPNRFGINYLINPTVVVPSATAPLIDPTTGQVVAQPPIEPMDMHGVMIRIVPPLRNVRLSDVLDAIVRVASQPIRYSIEEFGIVFSQKPPDESQALETRIFRVNPNTFLEGLSRVGSFPTGEVIQRAGGGTGGSGLSGGGGGGGGVFDLPRVFVTGGGGGFGEGGLPGVTSTNLTQDSQEMVSQFFQAAGINVMPPNQIYYKHSKGVLMVRATAEELDIIQQAVEVLNEPPPMITLDLRLVEITQAGATNAELERLRDSVDQKMSTGILTESQLESMLRQLEDRPGVRVVSGPRVTTLSGRETQLSLSTPDGVIVEVDCLPTVKSDGHTIVTRLVVGGEGAHGPGTTQRANSVTVERRSELSTLNTVLDGQTVVLGGLFAEDFQTIKDRAPALKDLPVIGELFPNDPADTRRHLVLLITPTIIHPAGNRVHPPDRRTFDGNRIPAQGPR